MDQRFDQTFKEHIESEINLRSLSSDFAPFTMTELNKALKKLNIKSAIGDDQIHNLMLKRMPKKLKCAVLALFNLSMRTSIMPAKWKESKITMIPKK